MEESEMKNNENANQLFEHFGFTYKLFLGAAICVVALSSAPTAYADDSSRPPIAVSESGVVVGSTTDGVNQFLGIPYAAPPVGSLRWTPPKRYGRFPGHILQATQFGSECTQAGAGSENCLFLNVFTPQVKSDDGSRDSDRHGLPVMFWLHVGGLTTGSVTPFILMLVV